MLRRMAVLSLFTIIGATVLAAGCSGAKPIAPGRSSSNGSMRVTEPDDQTTVVAGTLVVMGGVDGMTEGAVADNATVYLENLDVTVTTSKTGTFAIEIPDEAIKGASLTSGTISWYAVQRMRSGVGFGVEQPNIVVSRGERNELGTIMMQATGVLKGTIVLDGAANHAGVVVHIPGTVFKTTTDTYGNFRIDHVPAAPAPWRVEGLMTGRATMTQLVTVEPGKTEDLGTYSME